MSEQTEKTAVSMAIEYIDGTIALGQKARIESELLGLTHTTEIIDKIIESYGLTRKYFTETLLPLERQQIEQARTSAPLLNTDNIQAYIDEAADYYQSKYGV